MGWFLSGPSKCEQQSPLQKQAGTCSPSLTLGSDFTAVGSGAWGLHLLTGGLVGRWVLCVPDSKPASLAGMLRKLEIQTEEDLQSVHEVAAHMFSDGVTNWGRVVTLISFGAFVAKHLKSIKQEKCISLLAGIITDALVSSKHEWLMSQGSWVSHCLSWELFGAIQYFPVSVTCSLTTTCVSGARQ